jgi:hypothetical protein
MQTMTVSGVIAILQKMDPNSTVVIKDLNGCHWFMQPHRIVRDKDGDTIIDTQGINITHVDDE